MFWALFSFINRWLQTQKRCPLCVAPWVDKEGLTLAELTVVKSINNEDEILNLIQETSDIAIDPHIFSFLTDHTKFIRSRSKLIPEKQRLLAKTFAPYLTEDELNELLKIKKRDQKPNENKKND